MSGNIVIRQGLDQPWELNGTDVTKPDDINLLNLAVGQLAQIGSGYGDQISIQSNITAEIGEAVNIVQDRSAEVASKLDAWSQPVDFGITVVPADTLSTFVNQIYFGADVTSLVDKLIAATVKLNASDVFLSPITTVAASFVDSSGATVNFTSSNVIDQNFTRDLSVNPPVDSAVKVKDLQIYHQWLSANVWNVGAYAVNYQGVTYNVPADSIKSLWLPNNIAEVKNLQDQLTFSGMALNTSLLLDKTQVLPTPSDTVDPSTLPADSKVTLAIIVGDASAYRFKIPGLANKYFYPDKTIDQLKLVSSPSDLVSADDNTVVRTPTGYAWVQRSSSGISLLTVVPESFVATPTALQKASWLSQYSDKIVKITQRSAEQTNFLKMLTDRYTYFYEAATNVLQLLASLARQQARN